MRAAVVFDCLCMVQLRLLPIVRGSTCHLLCAPGKQCAPSRCKPVALASRNHARCCYKRAHLHAGRLPQARHVGAHEAGAAGGHAARRLPPQQLQPWPSSLDDREGGQGGAVAGTVEVRVPGAVRKRWQANAQRAAACAATHHHARRSGATAPPPLRSGHSSAASLSASQRYTYCCVTSATEV